MFRLFPAARGAVVVALLCLAYETVSLHSGGVSWLSAMGAAAPAALIVALVGWTFGCGVALLEQWVSARVALRPSFSLLIRWSVSLALVGYSAYALTLVTHRYLVATGTRAIAVAWLSVPAVALSLAAAKWVQHAVAKRTQAQPDPLRALQGLLLLAFIWATSLFLGEAEVFRGVSGWDWFPLLASMLAATLSAKPAELDVRIRAALAAGSALLIVAAGLGLARAKTSKVELAIAKNSHVTRLVNETLTNLSSNSMHTAEGQGGGTCRPGVAQPAARAIGKADKGAPDILLVTVDGVRWDHTSLSGYKRDTTPRLKRWAKKGAVFERAYSNSASTRQTFRSLLSGLLPSQVAPSEGVSRWAVSFPKGQETLASYLSAAGYETVSIQTSQTLDNEKEPGLYGFDVRDFAPMRQYRKLHYSADAHIERVMAHLDQEEGAKPRFVFTHLMEAHQPFLPGPRPKKFGARRRDRYDSALHMLDRQLDRIIAFATSPERRNNTILIIAADHGMGLDDRGGMGQHGNSLYDDQTHVPLLVFGKGIKPTRVRDAVSLLDLFPTVLDFAGLEPPKHVCGQSLAAVVTGKKKYEARPVVVQIFPDDTNPKSRISYIDADRKLILDTRSKTRMLFDLRRDPKELRDLSTKDPKSLAHAEAGLRKYLTERGLDPKDYDL